MPRIFCWLIPLLLLTQMATAEIRVHGYVADAASGETLIGANLNVLNQPHGAATNIDGYYVIVGLLEFEKIRIGIAFPPDIV